MENLFLVGTLIGASVAMGINYNAYRKLKKKLKEKNSELFLKEAIKLRSVLFEPSKIITEEKIKDMKEFGSTLSDYCNENNTENLMFIDSAARFANVAFKEMWKQKYGSKKTPNIYFTNPAGFQNELLTPYDLAHTFDNTYKNLAQNKSSSIMLVDTCLHSGSTIEPILEVLANGGYSNVNVCVMQPPDCEDNGFDVNLVCLDRPAAGECHPFGNLSYLSRRHNSMVSDVDPEYKKHAIEVRKYIKNSLKP